ncbi:MAG: type III pantothenate kinase [Bacteroidales bacterium]|nr:type III pantothenate kinase [Bacteroidales bacterium]
MSKILLIDIGNSSTKICWSEDGVLGEQKVIPAGKEKEEGSLLSALGEHSGSTRATLGEHSACSQKNKIMISSVSSRLEEMMPIFDGCDTYILKGTDKLPFKVSYQTKETLGPDRIAAIAGAIALYGKRDMLVVDMGTAITLDYYDSESNTFKGGNISPGVSLRFKSLKEYTSKLPLVEVKSDYKCKKIALGKNTEQAILEGVMQGVRLEIEGYRMELEKKAGKKILLVLTGGDSKYFHSSTKNCTFAPGNLVLRGLAYIDSWKAVGA